MSAATLLQPKVKRPRAGQASAPAPAPKPSRSPAALPREHGPVFARAVARYVRVTPRKAGYILLPLRGKTVADALTILSTTKRQTAKPVFKAVASAHANARVKDPAVRPEELVITRATADEGPRWKRFRAAGFGRAARILKRTSHITIELEKR